ncbi:hypothetical protein Tco_1225204 [Tanacetum coccineum]
MEEMLYKFIDEGRREHEEMSAFIKEFKTTNKLLLKERNNSLSELKFKVYGLSRAINDAQVSDYEVKEPNEVLVETKPQEIKEQTVKPPTPLISFPHRLKKENEEAQQRKFLENLKQLHINIPFTKALSQMPKYAKFLKGLLSNKTRLEEACTVTLNERCSTVLLNTLPSKEKDPEIFTIPCDIGHLHINNSLADLGAVNKARDLRVLQIGIRAKVIENQVKVTMSSATSVVTYTSVYTNSEPGRAFWGADDEEVSEGGIPRVIVLGYDRLRI